MSETFVIIIAVENYHDTRSFKKVDFAQNDANGIKIAFDNLGVEPENIEFLFDNYATKTAILERINRVSQMAEEADSIYFYYAGHGISLNGNNFILCVDSSINSLEDTSISLQEIMSIFEISKSTKENIFLDTCHSGITFEKTREAITDFMSDDLKYKYKDSEYLIGFASCKVNEKSRPDMDRKHGVWSYYLIQALSGQVPSIYEEGLLFNDKLQGYLKENTFHRVKEITVKKHNQTPIIFGKQTDRFIVADLKTILKSQVTEQHKIDIVPDQMKFIGEETRSVRSLPGFIKGRHSEPKIIDSYHDNWIKSISIKIIEDEISEIMDSLRSQLSFKRKDFIKNTVTEGEGTILTKYFDFRIEIEQDNEDAEFCKIIRSLENFSNSSIIGNDEFNLLFNGNFNKLSLPTSSSLNIENIIDTIEEMDSSEITVDYNPSDLSECIINLQESKFSLEIKEYEINYVSRKKTNPSALLRGLNDSNNYLIENSIRGLLE